MTLFNAYMGVIIKYLSSALPIGIALAALLYLFGKIVQSDPLKLASKNIILELFFIVAVVLFFIFPFMSIASDLVRSADPVGAHYYCQQQGLQNDPCFVLVGRGYNKAMLSESFGFLSTTLSYYNIVKILESTGGTLQGKTKGYEVAFGKSSIPFTLTLETFATFAQTILVVNVMQAYILDIFTNPDVFLNLLFVGVVLRVLPFSKKLGGMLMAIAIVMFFYFPSIMSIPDAIYFTIQPSSHTGMRLNRVYISSFLLKVDTTYPSFGDIKGGSSSYDVALPRVYGQTVQQGTGGKQPPPQYINYAGNFNKFMRDYNSRVSTYSKQFAQTYETLKNNPGLKPDFSPASVSFNSFSDFLKAFSQLAVLLTPIMPSLSSKVAEIVTYSAISLIPVPGSTFFANLVGGIVGFGVVGAVAVGSSLVLYSGINVVYLTAIQFADAIANFVIFSGVFSYVVLVSTIGAIKSVSQFLGGEIEIAGLSQLI